MKEFWMVTVAIHQPNYLPYLGYFEKIAQSDIFVFLDTVQYEKNGFTNRNRVRTTQGWCWLTVPVVDEGLSEKQVKDVQISNTEKWSEKHWKTLKQNYSKSPLFKDIASLFEETYFQKWTWLALLNEELILKICGLLNIKTLFMKASSLDVSGSKSDLLLDICEKVGADTYLSGPSGHQYLDESRFREEGITIVYQPTRKSMDDELSVVDQLFSECGGLAQILQLVSPALR
jgi:hypothetical protein